MSLESEESLTQLVRAARDGDSGAMDRVFSLAYDELVRLARVLRRGATPTLNTTALVHEAYLKLRPAEDLSVEDRAHFMHLVARAMRQVVVDAARRNQTLKRGGGSYAVTLEESAVGEALPADRILVLDEALTRLADAEPRRAEVVESRFFGGLSVEETASAMGISTATVKRDWRLARAWLAQAMAG